MSYTQSALEQQQVIRESFPSLIDNYQSYMGNFELSPEEFISKIEAISQWMVRFPDFRIVIEEGDFYLTDI